MGILVVGDCADGQRASLAHLSAAQADGLLRVYLPYVPLTTPEGQPFDAVSWLLQQHAPLVAWWGQCRSQRQTSAVRLIASKLPAAKVQAVQRRKRQTARKKQRGISAQTLQLASWQVLITTLQDPQTWPAGELVRLSRALAD